MFANGSLNTAENASAGTTELKAPKGTDAVSGYNLADHRSVTSITGPTAAGCYIVQAGREILPILEAKFR